MAPVLSVTVPSMRAVAVCAASGTAKKTITARTSNDFARDELISPPPVCWCRYEAGSIALSNSPRAAAVRRQRDAPRARGTGRRGHAGVGEDRVESARAEGQRTGVDRRCAEVVHDQHALVAGAARVREQLRI